MEKVTFVSVIGPCFSSGCPAYDPGMGCLMPCGLWHGCPLALDPDIKAEESEECNNAE